MREVGGTIVDAAVWVLVLPLRIIEELGERRRQQHDPTWQPPGRR